MRAYEITKEQLDEVDVGKGLRRLAQAGSLAASMGLGYTGYDLAKNYNSASASVAPATQSIEPSSAIKPVSTRTVEPSKDIQDPGTSIRPRARPGAPSSQITSSTDIHPAFPEKLLKQKEVDPDVRVKTFIEVILPYIKQENDRILNTRNQILSIVRKSKEKRPVSRSEIMAVRELYQKYGVDNISDLLKHIDIIPVSMALAQGAIESGWGSDYLARQGNAFYGQKSWSKTGGVEGPYGERYRAFESPADSVRAYMQNLNTHSAYSEFREARAQIRKSGKLPTGLALIPYLTKYSTLGQEYVKKVSGLIKGRQLGEYDR
jgi:uncharacterized FlgJ-related protein